ncbi:MAG TPA: Rieske 2Fe-2S domain-containing protein [Anaerolineales bacterium]|nr:Rieske 2Fe-2S domain-containing protein [Anaerolineales bacterium]
MDDLLPKEGFLMVANDLHPQHQPGSSDPQESGRYFKYMAQFVGFNEEDAASIRESALIIEKHLPDIIGRFYTNLMQYPPTRKHFLKRDGSVDEEYLQLRMYHQANFWRRVAGGVYDDDFANFVDYVGRAHTSRGADSRVYIAERYVIGMVGFVQHAIITALISELHEYDMDLEGRSIRAWNKLCMVILEMLARAYGHEREGEKYEELLPVDPDEMHIMSIESYEKSLGLQKIIDYKDIFVAYEEEIAEGDRKIIEVDGVAIGVFHHNGKWYAMRNSCLHRGGPVCTGKIEGDTITCPWHGYQYNLTDGTLLFDPGAKIEMYPITVIDRQVHLTYPVSSKPTYAQVEDEKGSSSYKSKPEDTRLLESNEFYLDNCPPGEKLRLRLKGQAILVTNIGGDFYATEEECTHAGGPLSEGVMEGETVICPWHGSCFNVITGEVTCPPATEPLKNYQVEIVGEIGRIVM